MVPLELLNIIKFFLLSVRNDLHYWKYYIKKVGLRKVCQKNPKKLRIEKKIDLKGIFFTKNKVDVTLE